MLGTPPVASRERLLGMASYAAGSSPRLRAPRRPRSGRRSGLRSSAGCDARGRCCCETAPDHRGRPRSMARPMRPGPMSRAARAAACEQTATAAGMFRRLGSDRTRTCASLGHQALGNEAFAAAPGKSCNVQSCHRRRKAPGGEPHQLRARLRALPAGAGDPERDRSRSTVRPRLPSDQGVPDRYQRSRSEQESERRKCCKRPRTVAVIATG